ncbi:hypothetical protein [Deinococcus apachensis]|uniref:hypothetical protein n=1 Tax=Deinococcus apachensis TaxID=309886 RepID=UPI000370A5CB|nr:hypothetical protein [Deinococcus apachensis]
MTLGDVLPGVPRDPRPLASVLAGAAPAVLAAVPQAVPVLGGIILPVPGPPGPPGTNEALPAHGDYPAGTVRERVEALQDRKAERTEIDLFDFALWLENQLL